MDRTIQVALYHSRNLRRNRDFLVADVLARSAARRVALLAKAFALWRAQIRCDRIVAVWTQWFTADFDEEA